MTHSTHPRPDRWPHGGAGEVRPDRSVNVRTGHDWRTGLGLPGRDDREWLSPAVCAERMGRSVEQVLVMAAAGALRVRRLGDDEIEIEPAIVNWPAA